MCINVDQWLRNASKNYLIQEHMTSASPLTMSKLFTVPSYMEKDHKNSMRNSTFNFLVDTLYEEILMHDHKYELLTLMAAQVADDT